MLGSSSLWEGRETWQSVAVRLTREWQRRAGVQIPAPVPGQPWVRDKECLRAAGFLGRAEHQFAVPYVWTLDAFTGYLRSTSVVARLGRAGVAGQFEAGLRSALLAHDPGGR